MIRNFLKSILSSGHSAAYGPVGKRLAASGRWSWTKEQSDAAVAAGYTVALPGAWALRPHARAGAWAALWARQEGPWAAPSARGGPLPLGAPGPSLGAAQRAAWMGLAAAGYGILTGGPGTGKTFLVGKIYESLRSQRMTMSFLAPTNKAAKVLKSKFDCPATTIHSALGINPDSKEEDVEALRSDIVVVDEASMVDEMLFSWLLKACSGKRILLVGDHYQIPSVGPGQVLQDLIGAVPTWELDHNFRSENGIASFAAKMRAGDVALDRYPSNGVELWQLDDEVIEAKLVNLYCGKYISGERKILMPFKTEKSSVSTRSVNSAIQEVLFKDGKLLSAQGKKPALYEGEQVIWTGGPANGLEWILGFQPGGYDDVEPAHCLTIHKAQGSEWDNVVVAIPNTDFCSKRLIYTACTRAKRRLLVIGRVEKINGDFSTDDRMTATKACMRMSRSELGVLAGFIPDLTHLEAF